MRIDNRFYQTFTAHGRNGACKRMVKRFMLWALCEFMHENGVAKMLPVKNNSMYAVNIRKVQIASGFERKKP